LIWNRRWIGIRLGNIERGGLMKFELKIIYIKKMKMSEIYLEGGRIWLIVRNV